LYVARYKSANDCVPFTMNNLVDARIGKGLDLYSGVRSTN
jgi:hypothetical protein